MSDALVRLLQSTQPGELTVHDRSSTGYAVTIVEELRDPAASQVTTKMPLTRDLEISRGEAKLLLSKGALWTGQASNEPH